MQLRHGCVFALLLLAACQAEPPAGGVPMSRQEAAQAAITPESAPAGNGNSHARWTGASSGALSFPSADCMVMNGQVIGFHAPAEALQVQDLRPQINGTATGGGWVINLQPPGTLTLSGTGTATTAQPPRLALTGTLIDGEPVDMTKAALRTVESTVEVTCTQVQDLGTF